MSAQTNSSLTACHNNLSPLFPFLRPDLLPEALVEFLQHLEGRAHVGCCQLSTPRVALKIERILNYLTQTVFGIGRQRRRHILSELFDSRCLCSVSDDIGLDQAHRPQPLDRESRSELMRGAVD
jgi:hypothetical protein